MRYLLKTPFKGSRAYIHGSDLYNHINDFLAKDLGQKRAYIGQLGFSSFTYNLCDLVFDECIVGEGKVAKGFVILDDNSKKTFYLAETTEVPSERYPFDEENLVARARQVGKSIELKGEVELTSIEVVIALTKSLSNNNMPLSSGKWVFGRIDLTCSLPVIKRSVVIECISSVAGRFSVNSIFIDGEQVGKIQFIVGNP